ncbi:hypothetical protein JTE90_010079, partial [Oedothorax gibbosus]
HFVDTSPESDSDIREPPPQSSGDPVPFSPSSNPIWKPSSPPAVFPPVAPAPQIQPITEPPYLLISPKHPRLQPITEDLLPCTSLPTVRVLSLHLPQHLLHPYKVVKKNHRGSK